MRPLFDKVVFISNSKLDCCDCNRITPYIDIFIQRENVGYDFGAWKDGINKIGYEEIVKYDHLVIMNDTCFGPMHDMGRIFENMESKNTDFWGLTKHKQRGYKFPFASRSLPEHIQSNFISFSKCVVSSKAFKDFWENVTNQKNIKKVIKLYEIQLTPILKRNGFNYKIFIENGSKEFDAPNIIFQKPHILIEHDAPFIKIKSMLTYQYKKYLTNLIELHSDYPIQFINEYFSRNMQPNQSLLFNDKNIICDNNGKENIIDKSDLNAALYFHVPSVNIFEKYIELLPWSDLNVDLFITTDSDEKKKRLLDFISLSSIPKNALKEIIVLPDKSGDILPWFSIQKRLYKYDLVGKFHTKQPADNTKLTYYNPAFDIFRSIGINIHHIINDFCTNPTLGIVIPDYPCNIIKANNILWQSNKKKIIALISRLKFKKSISISSIRNPIMPIDNMFWYRPDALQPLFELDLTYDDFTGKSQKREIADTIAKVVEMLPVYVAWSEGYDFKIAINKDDIYNGFSSRQSYMQNKSLEERVRKIAKLFPHRIIEVAKMILGI